MKTSPDIASKYPRYSLSITRVSENVLVIDDKIFGMFTGDSSKLLQCSADHFSVHVLVVGKVQGGDATLALGVQDFFYIVVNLGSITLLSDIVLLNCFTDRWHDMLYS